MTRRIMQGNGFGQRLDRQQNVVAVGRTDRQPDHEVIATAAADAFDDGTRKPGTVFQTAAPLIVARVAPRGPELIQQRMIGGPDLDPLKAGGLASDGGGNMRLDQLQYLGFRHAVRAVAVVIAGIARRRPVRRKGQVGIPVRADVIQLLQDHGTCVLDRFGDLAEMRDHIIRTVQEVSTRQNAGPMHRHGFGHDHRRPAQGAL